MSRDPLQNNLNVTLVFFHSYARDVGPDLSKKAFFGAMCSGSVFRIILGCLSESHFVSFDVV